MSALGWPVPHHVVRLSRRLTATFWFRPGVGVLVGAALSGLLILLGNWVGPGWLPVLSVSALEENLSPLATSSLTIATMAFSVVMVLFSLAAGQASPRALPELMADAAVQYALAIFLGIFAFSATALFALGMNVAQADARGMLAIAAVLGGVLLIAAFIHLIHHVSDFMKVGSLIVRVHRGTVEAYSLLFRAGEEDPHRETGVPPAMDPHVAVPVYADEPGFLLDIDSGALARRAERFDVLVEVPVRIGDFVSAIQPILLVHGLGDREDAEDILVELRDALDTGRERDVDSDPRSGLQLLGEIGCRALSPGINDPITAVICVDYIADLLARAAPEPPEAWPSARAHERVRFASLGFVDLLDAGLPLIARSCGSFFIVSERVLAVLDRLEQLADPAYGPALRALATETAERAGAALGTSAERQALERLLERTNSGSPSHSFVA